MGIDRGRGAVGVALVMLGILAEGCVSTGIRGDLDEIRQLADAVAIADVAGDVEAETDDDAHELLGAPLDADTAVRIALLNNRELRATLREVGVARGELLQAGLLPNPLIEASLAPERNTDIEIRVEWDVAGLILSPLRADIASAALDAARYHAASATIETGYMTRAAFHSVQAAEERLAISQRTLDAMTAARDAARALAGAGGIRALDLAVREAELEEERVHVAELELDVVISREELQRLLGLHGAETSWTVAAPLADAPADPVDSPDLERAALDASLSLREMRSDMERIGRRVGLARVEGVLPELLVDVHTLLGNPGGTDAVVFGGGVGLRLPIFDRGDGLVAAYEHELDAALERYIGMAINVRSTAREARARSMSARARARHYADVVLVARQHLVDETLLQYNAMQVSVFQLLEAIRTLQESQLAAVDARREYWTATAALGAVLAGHAVDGHAMEPREGSTTRGER